MDGGKNAPVIVPIGRKSTGLFQEPADPGTLDKRDCGFVPLVICICDSRVGDQIDCGRPNSYVHELYTLEIVEAHGMEPRVKAHRAEITAVDAQQSLTSGQPPRLLAPTYAKYSSTDANDRHPSWFMARTLPSGWIITVLP